MSRLLLFAFISQIPFNLFQSLYTNTYNLNIFYTLFLGLLLIIIYERIKNFTTKKKEQNNSKFYTFIINFFFIALLFIFCFLSEKFKFDYGFFGVCTILLFHIFKDKKILTNISFTLLSLIKYILDILTFGYHYLYILFFIGTISSLIFINLYNRKQGKKIKYLLYLFYPTHLLILYLLFK